MNSAQKQEIRKLVRQSLNFRKQEIAANAPKGQSITFLMASKMAVKLYQLQKS